MKFECQACDTVVEHDVRKGHAPSGWRMHTIKSRSFLLCAACGSPASFAGGLAPVLKEQLAKKHGLVFGSED